MYIGHNPNITSIRKCLIGVIILCLISKTECGDNPPRLILISMDSLMYEFLKDVPRESMEHFQHIMDNGVLLKQMMNVFPSSTYPNHYTLLTGLYPESHGLVNNQFYDPVLKASFSLSVAKDNYESKWYDTGAEPIYVTNSKAGAKRKSGTVLLPTGMARVKGIRPDRMVEDDGTYPNMFETLGFPYVNMSYTARVDRIVSWFTDVQDPINLGLLYFPEPDELSHEFGPKSVEVRKEITGPLNTALGYLFQKLKDANLLQSTNIILTADHGQTRRTGFVYLNDYIDAEAYTVVGSLPAYIYPIQGKGEEVFRNLSRATDMEVFRRDSPEMRSIHYTNNERIAPIIAYGREGIVITRTRETARNYKSIGVHGYDPVKVPSMRPLFMALGPAFKKGFVSSEFHSVDVYPLMCHLLDVTPAPCNGSLDNVRHLLNNSSGKDVHVLSSQLLIGLTLIHRFTSSVFSDI